MNCSFTNRHPTSLVKCLKKKGIHFLSQEEFHQGIDSLTVYTKSQCLSYVKYFHVRHAHHLLRIYLLLLVLALFALGSTLYHLRQWWPTPSFENVTSFGLVCLVLLVLSIVIAGFRDYLRGMNLIRKWHYTKWMSIDDWQKMKVKNDEELPQNVSCYLEVLSDVNSELKVRVQYTLRDGVYCSGMFLIIYDRTYETYYALFWH